MRPAGLPAPAMWRRLVHLTCIGTLCRPRYQAMGVPRRTYLATAWGSLGAEEARCSRDDVCCKLQSRELKRDFFFFFLALTGDAMHVRCWTWRNCVGET